jgi:hypothetical protein
MNISQGIARRVFKDHGPYEHGTNGAIVRTREPLLKHAVSRLGAMAFAVVVTAEAAALSCVSAAGQNTNDAVAYGLFAAVSAVGSGLVAHDHLYSANRTLPDSVGYPTTPEV